MGEVDCSQMSNISWASPAPQLAATPQPIHSVQFSSSCMWEHLLRTSSFSSILPIISKASDSYGTYWNTDKEKIKKTPTISCWQSPSSPFILRRWRNETRVSRLNALISSLLSSSQRNHTDGCFHLFWLINKAQTDVHYFEGASTPWSQGCHWLLLCCFV